MLDRLDIVLTLTNGLGIMALTAMAFGQIERTSYPPSLRAAAQGFVFGLGAIVAMMSPAHITEGIMVDARSIFVGLAGAFGGPIAAAVAVALAGIARLYYGGAGALPGIAGIVISAAAGLVWRHFYRNSGDRRISDYIVLGLLISLRIVSAVFLPDDFPFETLLVTGPITSIASVLAAIVLGGFIEREIRLVHQERSLRMQATTDPLTGLLNRRSFDARLDDALSRPEEIAQSALLVIDIDHFKSINDMHGHANGDEVIKRVGRIITDCVRQMDAVARIGGEEFGVFLPGISLQQSRDIASRIRSSVESANSWPVSIKVTASIGVNWLAEPRLGDRFFAGADAALYAAKNSGRNRVAFVSLSTPPVAAGNDGIMLPA